MITTVTGGGNSPITFFGLSTDTKPSEIEIVKGLPHAIPNASIFYEMNTGDMYMWDADGNRWLKQ